MKEATGELNATVVVVLAIGVLIAFFYYTLWPLMKDNFNKNSQCSKAICESCNTGNCDYVTCHPKNDPTTEFECVYKG
ncbi:MAG: hypothetical protein E7161_00285 [Firmicutes bacterium]|nr:hypothetical protein [Bacillota bacterium]